MPTAAAECRGGASLSFSMSFRGLSVLSLRRNQIAYIEPSSEEELRRLDLLHSRLTTSLQSLLPLHAAGNVSIVSFSFLHKLLDEFLSCDSAFKSLLLLALSRNPSLISQPPLDRAISDLLDRALRSLDLCNAVSLSIDSLRHWNRHAEIAASALVPNRTSARPQLNRACRSLSKLLILPADAGRGSSFSFSSSRNSRSWSAARSSDSGSSAVLALAAHTISTILSFAIWALVAAFPCFGGTIPPPPPLPQAAVPRQIPWAVALADLQEKISEEWRKDRKSGGMASAAVGGILTEKLAVERSGREVMEAVRNGEETAAASGAAELAAASRILEEGLTPLEMKVREVFQRVLRSREEVLRCLDEGSRSSFSPIPSPC